MVQRRDRQREQRALHDLAAWAYQFSARLSFEPCLLLLEIGASLRLFGGRNALLTRLQRELGQLVNDVYGADAVLRRLGLAIGKARRLQALENGGRDHRDNEDNDQRRVELLRAAVDHH